MKERENWNSKWLIKWKGVRNRCGERNGRTIGSGILKSACFWGGCVQVSLGCATDHEREGNRKSMGMLIAEMYSSEIWTLRKPCPKNKHDPQWKVKDTNRTNIISTRNWSCVHEIQVKNGAENKGLTRLDPGQLETHPTGKHQSLTLLRIYFLILP